MSSTEIDPEYEYEDEEEYTETDHDVLVAVDEISEFLSSHPAEFWPKTTAELRLFLESFQRVPFELQAGEMLDVFFHSKILFKVEGTEDDYRIDLELIKSFDMKTADTLLADYEAEVEKKRAEREEKRKLRRSSAGKSEKEVKEEQEYSRLRFVD